MRRKTIIWIVAAVLAAAVLAAVGVVAYHVGFHHGATRAVAVGPLRRFGLVTPRVVIGATAGFSAATSLLLLLIGGAVGAAIGYLAWGGRAGAAVAQPAVVATSAQPPVAAGAPVNPLWQQFDEWHRSVHAAPAAGAVAEGVTAPPTVPPVATSTPPAPETAVAPPQAPGTPEPPAEPQPPASPEPPARPSDSA